MSGHSHSSNVAARKDKQDKQRSKMFSRISREIITLAKQGGVENNARLSSLIQRARSLDMPAASIQRAVKIGTGELEEKDQKTEECIYEAVASGNAVAVMCTTDNKNRTAAEVSRVLKSHGIQLAKQNTAMRLFKRIGSVKTLADSMDSVIETCLGIDGIEDVAEDFTITCDPAKFYDVLQQLREKMQVDEEHSEIALVASIQTEWHESTQKLISDLEQLDDVDCVVTDMARPT